MSADQFAEYFISGLTQGSIYALIALGFTIIYAVTKIINFAQGEFVMLGGMLSYILASSWGLSMPLAIILSIFIAGVAGIAMYILAIRTARKASVVSLIIITIGAAIFIRGIAGVAWKDEGFVRPAYFTGNRLVEFAGLHISIQEIWIIGITVLVTILLHSFLSYTVTGKALKACAINPKAASLMGINIRTMALIAFALAAILGAIGGVAIAPKATAWYGVGVMLGLKGFVAASIGGFSSPLAAVGGGFALGIVESLAVGINWGPFTSAYKDAIAIVVLLIILLIRSGRLAAEERMT